MASAFEPCEKAIVNGRNRIIYRKQGSLTKYIKSKGTYVKVSDYKKQLKKVGGLTPVYVPPPLQRINTYHFDKYGNMVDNMYNPKFFVNSRGQPIHPYKVDRKGRPINHFGRPLLDVNT